MFFKPRVWEKGESVALADHVTVRGADGYAQTLAEKLNAYTTSDGTIKTIEFCDRLPADFEWEHSEGYAITITCDTITIYAESLRGNIYAVQTLLDMLKQEELFVGKLCDAPDCSVRGYRVFLPGRKNFDNFKAMIDMIVAYKYNCIFIEVGGAMEYHRHPEINEAWRKFVAMSQEYSGKIGEILGSFSWSKNCAHTDNGDGDILTQEEVKSLVEYCRERGLEVYPEVPTLSHCDYICMAHPEIAERQDDPYPDSYCPNHPDTYPIVFDVLEEIIEVFKPKMVNIGHDEMYSIGVCERCRDTEPHMLYVQDIIKLHDWLNERGIKTVMWGEKLLPVILKDGRHYGGAGGRRRSSNGKEYDPVPVLFYCQNMLPKDILMLHWYASFGIQYDYVYHTHGYPVIFGNLAAASVAQWRTRRELGVFGGVCSNWGSCESIYMQRNNQYFNLVFSAAAMWSAEYDDVMLPQLKKETFEECYRLKFGELSKKPHFCVTHNTDRNMPYRAFYDGAFIEAEKYYLGDYVATYDDGSTARFAVNYGENISSASLPCDFGDGIDNSSFEDEGNLDSNGLCEVACSTMPGRVGDETLFTTIFPDPHPEKKLCSFTFERAVDDCEVNLMEYSRNN